MNEWISQQSVPRSSVTSGQICQVLGVPVEWIMSFPSVDPLTQRMTTDITLLGGKSWIPFLVASTGKSVDEESKSLNGSNYWEHKLSGNFYWQNADQHIQFNNMVLHRWVFLVKEGGTGLIYIIGKPSAGATVSINYSNKSGTVTSLTASHRALHRMIIYGGVTEGAYSHIFEPYFESYFE